MEVVNRLPRPKDPAALTRLVDAQRILCSRCVSEDDCEAARGLLEELAGPPEAGGFDYFPALLTLGSLYEAGFEPAIPKDGVRAARYYLQLLRHPDAATGLATELLEEAATQLCSLVKDDQAKLGDEELQGLKELSQGQAAGGVVSVATWARFAFAEGDRLLQESRVDPAVRAQREARRQAREKQREEQLVQQRAAAAKALAEAEDLRQQGNDEYRQGQLPGNARCRIDFSRAVELYEQATVVLTECLRGLTVAADEIAEIRKQRGILHSNAAQVQVMVENWAEAIQLSRLALEDDPDGLKPRYRLARSHVGLGAWEDAAHITDEALKKTAEVRGKDADAMTLELWKLAEEITRALPGWQWSSAKPKPKEEKVSDDYEKRIVGIWEYGEPGSGNCFEIKLEKWGALLWKEKDMVIDLLRKSKLRWRGEYEMISGMVLEVSYEPGADVLITDFTPPPDVPEEHKWQGPTKFTSRRCGKPPEDDAPPQPIDLDPPPDPSTLPQPPPEVAPEPVNEPACLPESTPLELWLTGNEACAGHFKLSPDDVGPGSRPGSHAVYKRSDGDTVQYLWFRGGNWGITAALNASSLAAPFLARCPDASGLSRHPLEVRRPRWHVRRGRQQEAYDSGVSLGLTPAGATEIAQGGQAAGFAPASRTEVGAVAAGDGGVPAAVVLLGRVGTHSEANGQYHLTKTSWNGRPVYAHEGNHELDRQDRQFTIFYDNGNWALAPEVSSLPKAIARCRAAESDAAHPAAATGTWEFLCGESRTGHMSTIDSRTYSADRVVKVQAASEGLATRGADGTKAVATESSAVLAPTPSTELSVPSSVPSWRAEQAPAGPGNGALRASWVKAVATEVVGGEVRASICVRDDVSVDLQTLTVDVAAKAVVVSLAGEAFELELPVAVDPTEPTAPRWSESTRKLRLRLRLAAPAPANLCQDTGMD